MAGTINDYDPVDLLAVQLADIDPSERIGLVATLLKKCLAIDVVAATDEASDDFDKGMTEFLGAFIAKHGVEGVVVG